MNTKITGNAGEEKAAQYLINQGYSIIGRNFRTKGGEVDIIALKDDVVVRPRIIMSSPTIIGSLATECEFRHRLYTRNAVVFVDCTKGNHYFA